MRPLESGEGVKNTLIPGPDTRKQLPELSVGDETTLHHIRSNHESIDVVLTEK